MKPKIKKLKFNKETVASLNNLSMNNLKGGAPVSYYPDYNCYTDDDVSIFTLICCRENCDYKPPYEPGGKTQNADVACYPGEGLPPA